MKLKNRKTPLLAVDVIIMRKDGSIVLVKRKNDPFRDFWAIPGGFVKYGESVENAAIREAKEETGLEVGLKRLVGVYSDPNRDPRGHVVSVVFLAEEINGCLKANSDAKEAKAFKVIPKNLAFDHKRIIRDAAKTFGLKIKFERE